MGKGDKRSRKGKIWSSSYGNSRPKNKNIVKSAVKPAAKAPEATPPAADTAE